MKKEKALRKAEDWGVEIKDEYKFIDHCDMYLTSFFFWIFYACMTIILALIILKSS